MTVLRFPRFGLCLAALALAGCAAHVPWVNPQLPKAQWGDDWSSCKHQAEAGVLGSQPEDVPGGPLETYDRAEAKGRIDADVAECMSELGYVPAPRKGN